MKIIARSLGVALLLALAAAAQWTAIGAMPAGRREGASVVYQNERGLLRLSAPAPGIIRVRFTPAAELARAGRDHSYALAAAAPASGEFTFVPGADEDQLTTSLLTLRIARNPVRLAFYDRDGRLLGADAGDGMAFDTADAAAGGGARVRVWKQLDDYDHFFGLGEKTGPLDKRGMKLGGTSYVMWNSDVFGYDNSTDPLYADIPLLIVLHKAPDAPALAHGLFFDNTFRASFDLGRRSRQYFDFGAEGGELNYYFIAGPTPRDVLERYARLTGTMPLPPLWAIGYQQSRYSYYPASQVLEIARQFRQRDIPADGIWLDIAYMNGYRVFTWNPTGFPQPRQLLAQLHGLGFHAVAIIDPGVKQDPGYAVYDSGLQAGVFARRPDGSLFVGPVWPGPAVFPDFTDAAARAWWAHEIASFAAAGLSGIWNDMNEPSVFNTPSGTMPDDVRFANAGAPSTAAETHNVFGQQMSRATQAGLLELHPEARPFVLTRDTYAGGQRYAALWTGDNTADWGHLRNGITTLLGLGLSGFPFVGNDIGGFAGVSSADLWTRWAEAAAFFPFMRGHAMIDTPPKEPWAFGPAAEAANRAAIARRYRFLPYIYDAFYASSRSGLPMMRALVLDYPDDPRTYDLASEFLFGDDLLVAPILAPHATSRSVYLPAGSWHRIAADASDAVFAGPATVQVAAEEAQLPLFARDGAILFLSPPRADSAEWQTAPLIFDVRSRQATARQYYEDDGATFAYRRGVYFLRTVAYAPGALETTVTLSAAQGSYRPRHPSAQVVLHDVAAPAAATLDGVPLAPAALSYSGTRQLTITLPWSAAAQRLVIRWR